MHEPRVIKTVRNAIGATGFPVLHLFRRDDPNDAYIDEATDVSGRVHLGRWTFG